jgi:UDP-N-acetylglucosamine 2-epimerase (non-hydrolysing)
MTGAMEETGYLSDGLQEGYERTFEKMITVLSVIGTRPEVIKMAPVIAEMNRHSDSFRSVLCVTGQHREMLDQTLEVFGLKPDYDLDVMLPDQSLSLLTSRLLEGLDSVVRQVGPDWMLAQGDTTSVMSASLTACYHRIPFGHVEAGLRTADINSPFPEEVNRRLTDVMATIWFAPTERARGILLKEGCIETNVLLTGNTVVDALKYIVQRSYDWSVGPLSVIPDNRRLVLVTVHRRESFGHPLREICSALRRIDDSFADEGVHLVCPVHPNPQVREPVFSMLSGVRNISLLEPIDYPSLIQLLQRTTLVLSDSGGIQEEAPSFGVPVLIMRNTTERGEGVDAGIARLVGTTADSITENAFRLLRDSAAHAAMTAKRNPYGDGKAAERIVAALKERMTR